MRLDRGLHLAYCTNIHRGETWAETFSALQNHTLAVRDRVSPGRPYAIGLRLSWQAVVDLQNPAARSEFRRWLDRENCYVFTINGFPYGRFHGVRVKEQVYQPDWTTPERVDYTNQLFDLLVEILPEGMSGSVSTVPCSFKEFITTPEQVRAMRENLWQTVAHIAQLSERTGRDLHLGLEPEPLCYLETSLETVRWFEQMRDDRPHDPRLAGHLGVNYDTCHLAVEFEEPADVVRRFEQHEIRMSKLHLSSALKVRPTRENREMLKAFCEDVYFHQVIARSADAQVCRFRDLDVALREPPVNSAAEIEWRIHFHVPLHAPPTEHFSTTADHILGILDILRDKPQICSHLEMETYTWEVLPPNLKNRSVVEHLVSEYQWTLEQLGRRALGPC